MTGMKSEMTGDYNKLATSSAEMKAVQPSDVIDSCNMGRLWKMKVSERLEESGRGG